MQANLNEATVPSVPQVAQVAPATERYVEWCYIYDPELEVLRAISNQGSLQTMHVPRQCLPKLYHAVWAADTDCNNLT